MILGCHDTITKEESKTLRKTGLFFVFSQKVSKIPPPALTRTFQGGGGENVGRVDKVIYKSEFIKNA